MSGITEVTKTANQLNTSYDVSKIALGNNEFISADYTSTGEIDIAEGTVFGRIHATGKIAILDKDASNGSAYPVGVFFNGIAGPKHVGATTTVSLTLINKGKVNADKLAFASGTTISSVVGVKQLRDHLNDIGLVLESSTQLSSLDNA